MPLATSEGDIARTKTRIERTTNQSAANTAMTVSSPVGGVRKVLYALVNYSAAPTHAGITYILNSALGSAWDHTFKTSTANDQRDEFFPTRDAPVDLALLDDDVFDVTAPAGGVGITSTITLVTEVLG